MKLESNGAYYPCMAATAVPFPWRRWAIACASGLAAFFFILVFAVHARNALLWLDDQEEWVVCLVFLGLYTAVSFPLTWGYILLNVACGYRFGPALGVLVTGLEASLGLAVAHTLMRHSGWLVKGGRRLLAVGYLRSLLAALDSCAGGSHTFKLVAFSRLTPIPFGLQNALFAASPIKLPCYVGASAVGLLPTQALNCYLGSTLRSMEDVMSHHSTATQTYLVFLCQVLLTILLTVILVRRARREITKTLQADLCKVTVC